MADPLMVQGSTGIPADPAAAPEGDAPSPQETATFETMVAGLLEHLYGAAKEGVVKQLKESDNPARVAGTITLTLVQEAARQAEAAQQDFDMDMLLGVATEIIESLMKIAQAAKVKIGDPEAFMAEALFSAIQAYIASTPPGSEEQEQAKAMLAEMQQAGLVQEGAAELQRLGQKAGVDPFAQAQQPQETPMAQGIRAGLMGG